MKKLFINLIWVGLLITLPERSFAQLQGALPRQAYLGARFSNPSSGQAGAVIRRIDSDSPASRLGWKVGDRLMKINGILLNSPSLFRETLQSLKGGSQAQFTWVSGEKWVEKQITLATLPKETFKGVETEYQSVLSPYGYRVQTILNRPKNAQGKLPGIFLVRWLSCSPVEEPIGRKGGTDYFFQQIIEQSGAVVMRVEKPGLGDSEGPPCRDVDFVEELAAHRAALQTFANLEYVDKNKIIVLGLSNGGGYAPLVAQDMPVAGYAIMGGWVKTWFEHMLEIERRRFELRGENPNQVSQRMKLVSEFYTDYLIKKKLPSDILKEKPQLKDAWEFEPGHQYGIPAAYFQQLQALNLADAWNKVKAPTLVMYGEYDWIMSRSDHEMIAEIVGKNNANQATFTLLPQTDHSFHQFKNAQQAFDDYWSGNYDEEIGKVFLDWFEKIAKDVK